MITEKEGTGSGSVSSVSHPDHLSVHIQVKHNYPINLFYPDLNSKTYR